MLEDRVRSGTCSCSWRCSCIARISAVLAASCRAMWSKSLPAAAAPLSCARSSFSCSCTTCPGGKSTCASVSGMPLEDLTLRLPSRSLYRYSRHRSGCLQMIQGVCLSTPAAPFRCHQMPRCYQHVTTERAGPRRHLPGLLALSLLCPPSAQEQSRHCSLSKLKLEQAQIIYRQQQQGREHITPSMHATYVDYCRRDEDCPDDR